MSKIVTNEFFKSLKKYDDGKLNHDFSDKEVITPEERFEFLTHYADFMEKTYDLPEVPKKVFSEEQAKEELEALLKDESTPCVSKRILFKDLKASTLEKEDTLGWQLYTRYSEIKDDAVIFHRHHYAPSPAALYNIKAEGKVREFTFKVYIDSEYTSFISKVISSTTARTIEFRNGILDIIKLHFYPNGEFFACLGDKNEYILDNQLICNYEYNKWQTVKIVFNEEDFTVSLNEIEKTFPYSNNLNPNTLFVGSGMFHIGEWHFKPVSLKTDKEEVVDFFEESEKINAKEESLGTVNLPYRIGGFKNRDKYLILTKEFFAPDSKKAVLDLDSLDPHGTVYVNGKEVIKTDGFERQTLDIAPYLNKNDNNEIKIIVDPRAPETLFNWHRQTDTYNGWFCERVSLTFINECEVKDILVRTNKVCDKVSFAVSASLDAKKAEIRLKKIYPTEQDEFSLGVFDVKNGELSESFERELDAWTPDTPNLYAVRVIALDENGKELDDDVIETGFRTIEQKNGDVVLNGEPIVLSGALLMQFLPPHDDTPTTHICPRDEQLWQQERLVRKMGGNTLRLHMLGYGSNDVRYARYADRIGLMLIWITRYIDSAEQMAFGGKWPALDGYIRQISQRRNHPSIIIWEGSNEYHPNLEDINNIYTKFVPAVKEADPTRLICPISHLYYAGDLYPYPGCGYYNDDGDKDHDGNAIVAPKEWCDEKVVRSSHTYDILLGYGTGWKTLREQNWSIQDGMFYSKKHAYLVTEYAIIGRQNPNTPECKEYFNDKSYEVGDENVLGFKFKTEDWRQSQAYQALAAKAATQILNLKGADGMLWCCLMSGANNGSYLKPPIDCYGYPKYSFYTLKESFLKKQVFSKSVDVLKGSSFSLEPVVMGLKEGEKVSVTAEVLNENGEAVTSKKYNDVVGNSDKTVELEKFDVNLNSDGYFSVRYTIE